MMTLTWSFKTLQTNSTKAIPLNNMYTERDLKAAFRAGETNERNEAYDESGKGFDHWFKFEFAIAPAEKERLLNNLLVEAKKLING